LQWTGSGLGPVTEICGSDVEKAGFFFFFLKKDMLKKRALISDG
jgi:hypothetical protein